MLLELSEAACIGHLTVTLGADLPFFAQNLI